MAEYINKAKLYEAVAEREDEYRKALLSEKNYNTPNALQDQGLLNATTLIKYLIADFPASADVVPVVRGHWIYTKKRLTRGGCVDASECSICHKRIMPHLKPNYCPNCGAKMEEEGNG